MNEILDVENQLIAKPMWFDEINKLSNGLKKEVLVKGVLNEQTIEKLIDLTDESFRTFCDRQSFLHGFRVWRNDEQKNVHFIRDRIFNQSPKPNEKIEPWLKRVFDGDALCILMNEIEHCEDELAILMSKIFKPVIDDIGIPLNGLHSSCFIGNYGFTPLGIHHDRMGAFVLNCHIGPGRKKMYIWEWDHFLSLGGKKNNEKNIEKFLPEATEYILDPGDIFFMPWDKFHIAYSEDYSISLTNWFDFHSTDDIMNDVIHQLRNFLRSSENFYPEAVTEHNHKDKFREVLDGFKFEGGRDQLSLKENIIDAQELRMMKFFSNGGWKSVPVTLSESSQFDIRNTKLFDDRNLVIELISPFKIHYKIQSQQIYFAARGHLLKFHYEHELIEIVDRLNSFDRISITELLHNKPPTWSDDSLHFFISSLYNVRALNLV